MDEHEITDRLRSMGDEPVPDEARTEHLRRIAATPVEPGRPFGRVWVAAAAIIGFLVGSTGLAAAGALPDPAQDVAHDVLSVVQIDVPEGKRGPCVSAIAKSDLPKAEKKAAKDACPKGGNGGTGEDIDDDGEPGESGEAPGRTKHADDPCKGKPPWAGQKGLSTAEKDAMKAERAATCGRDLDDEDDDLDEDEDVEDAEVTTTTAAPTTTTAPSTTLAPTTTVADATTTTTAP